MAEKLPDPIQSVNDVVVPAETADKVLQAADAVVIYQPVIPTTEKFANQIEVDKALGIETPTEYRIPKNGK